MKASRFILVASMVLAMIFTFSCSSDENKNDDNNSSSSSSSDGGSGSIDMSGFSKQLYLDGEEYKGNGDVMLILDSDTLPAGRIQNGLITLDLPKNIDDKHLVMFSDDCYNLYEDCENISYPRNLASIVGELYTIIPNEGLCSIDLMMGNYKGIGFTYYSESGEITGTVKYKPENMTVTYDVNISKGWNIFYVNIWDNNGDIEAEMSTDSKIIEYIIEQVGEPKWRAYCGLK